MGGGPHTDGPAGESPGPLLGEQFGRGGCLIDVCVLFIPSSAHVHLVPQLLTRQTLWSLRMFVLHCREALYWSWSCRERGGKKGRKHCISLFSSPCGSEAFFFFLVGKLIAQYRLCVNKIFHSLCSWAQEPRRPCQSVSLLLTSKSPLWRFFTSLNNQRKRRPKKKNQQQQNSRI